VETERRRKYERSQTPDGFIDHKLGGYEITVDVAAGFADNQVILQRAHGKVEDT
jgi:hypothetical protein